MSQLLFVLCQSSRNPAVEGFQLHALEDPHVRQSLDALICRDMKPGGSWVTLATISGEDFGSYFDANFQTVTGRDMVGRTLIDLLSALCEWASAVVLAYSRVESDIDLFRRCDEFIAQVTHDYSMPPVEVNAAYFRMPQHPS